MSGALKGKHKPGSITYYEYLAAVYRLGFTPCSIALSQYVGLSVRQLERIYNKKCPIPPTVGRLLSLTCAMVGQKIPYFKESKRARLAAESTFPPFRPRKFGGGTPGEAPTCRHGTPIQLRCPKCPWRERKKSGRKPRPRPPAPALLCDGPE